MKNSPAILPILWGAAILSVVLGFAFSLSAVGKIGSTKELWGRKADQFHEMMALRATATSHRALVNQYAQYPATPSPIQEVARLAAPGMNPAIRATEVSPSVPGWTARKIHMGLTDITGSDLGLFLEAAGRTTPPWAVLECTLTAGAAPGRLSKVEITLVTVER